jgi:hypothetical protein
LPITQITPPFQLSAEIYFSSLILRCHCLQARKCRRRHSHLPRHCRAIDAILRQHFRRQAFASDFLH